MRVGCFFCGATVDSDSKGVYQYVSGWERRRDKGGTNAIRLPERQSRWACHSCIEERAKGLENQNALF